MLIQYDVYEFIIFILQVDRMLELAFVNIKTI